MYLLMIQLRPHLYEDIEIILMKRVSAFMSTNINSNDQNYIYIEYWSSM